MLYLSFLKQLTPILAVTMVKRLQEIIGTGQVINWSSEQPFRHNLFHVLTALCAHLKAADIQFVKTSGSDETLFFLEINDAHPYFLEIFNADNAGFQHFLLKPRNLELVKDNRHLTLNLQKLLIELYFFVNLEKRLNEVLELKRGEAAGDRSEEIPSDSALHAELLLMAANLNLFAEKMAFKKNYSDAGATADMFKDFHRFITQLNQATIRFISTSESDVTPLVDMKYEQAFVDPLFALGFALLDYTLSKSIQDSTVDYSAPQSLLALPSSAAHFVRMTQSFATAAVKLVTSKTLSTEKIEQNQTAIWNIIEYYYRQFLSRKNTDFQPNFDTAQREVRTTKNDFESNRGVWTIVKGVVKGNDFPRVLDAAQTWFEEMLSNCKADRAWILGVDPAYFESGLPPSRKLGQTKYKMLALVPESDMPPEHPVAPVQLGTSPRAAPLRVSTPKQSASTPPRLLQAQLEADGEADAAEDDPELLRLGSSPGQAADPRRVPGGVRKSPAHAEAEMEHQQQQSPLPTDGVDETEFDAVVDLDLADASGVNDGALPVSAPPIAPQHEKSTVAKSGDKPKQDETATSQAKRDKKKKSVQTS